LDEIVSTLTKINEYEPTTAEKKLLEVLLNPENAGKSITEKCKIADISRTHYYDIMHKPEFLELCNVTAIDLIKGELMPLMAAAIKEAKNGSFQHFKILMEMHGLYREKSDINVNADTPLRAAVMQMSDTDINSKIAEYIKSNPNIVISDG
jgi:hypothetical protein